MPHHVQVNTDNVVIDNIPYNTGAVAVIEDEAFAEIPQGMFTSGRLTDLGEASSGGGMLPFTEGLTVSFEEDHLPSTPDVAAWLGDALNLNLPSMPLGSVSVNDADGSTGWGVVNLTYDSDGLSPIGDLTWVKVQQIGTGSPYAYALGFLEAGLYAVQMAFGFNDAPSNGWPDVGVRGIVLGLPAGGAAPGWSEQLMTAVADIPSSGASTNFLRTSMFIVIDPQLVAWGPGPLLLSVLPVQSSGQDNMQVLGSLTIVKVL